MKSILISIQPKWCELIASGKKTVEVRKTRPKCETPFKCYIYETKGKSGMPTFIDEDGHISYEGSGKVIGEFVCDRMFDFIQAGAGIMFAQGDNQLNPKIALKLSCLSDKEIDDYLGDKDGYGWHISNLIIYEKPKELSEFTKPYGTIIKAFDSKFIERPPQSWCYVEEME